MMFGLCGADVVDVGLQLLAHARHLVGEEDVGDRRELVEDVAALVLVEVEREAELAAVGVLEDGRHVAGEDRHAGGRQAPGGVAAGDVLHLDDLGAPVAEDGRRRRHERVVGEVEDADALHGAVRAHATGSSGIRTQSNYGRQVNARHDPEPRAAPYALQ